ncbi:MAG: aspartate aminotransferase family protein [Synergistaceae bacterium]|nr:aspartate aminotransferase family protein [Synergistaceae bacterium]
MEENNPSGTYGKLLEKTASIAARWLDSLPDRPVNPALGVEELRKKLGGSLSEKGADPAQVVEAFAERITPGLTASPGPRYFGFVTGGALPASLGADWLTSAWDQNAVLSIASPAAAAAEEIVASWILDLLDFPSGCSVGFVTGCQMANFTCLAAARHEVFRKASWNVEEEGLAGAPALTILAGEEAHATLFVALRMLGLGTKNILRLPGDAQGRMEIRAAKEALEKISGPAILCLQAGNVNSGAFDPCADLIPLAQEKGAWVHVDGAFGLWGKLLPELNDHTKGMELADSWATDAHKWLNVPYDSGLAIVRHQAAHRAAMALNAPYYIAAPDEVRDPSQWVPESSRRARAFPLYCGLKSLGKQGLRELVERNCRQARLIASLLEEDPSIRILNNVVLNQVLVEFLPSGEEDRGTFTRRVTAAIQEEGTCWAGGSLWKGRPVLRISVSNWSTTDTDIRISAEAIRRVLANLNR